MRTLRLALALAVLCAGCGDRGVSTGPDASDLGGTGLPDESAVDGTGDPGPGGSVSIRDIRLKRNGVAEGSLVTVRGVVVTAIDAFGATTGNVWVQDPAGGAYSGLLLYDALASATLVGGPLAVGDLVDVENGRVVEWAPAGASGSLTELVQPPSGAMTLRKVGSGTLPAPAVVDPVAIAADPAEAGKWVSVPVHFERVAVTSLVFYLNVDHSVHFTYVTGPILVLNELAPLVDQTTPLVNAGDCLAMITGIGDWRDGFRLFHRSRWDLVAGGTGCAYERPKDGQCHDGIDNNHDGRTDCADPACVGGDASCTLDASVPAVQDGTVPPGAVVRLRGVVATALDGARQLVWVQDPAGGPHSGVLVYFDDVRKVPAALEVGGVLEVVGTVTEYFGETEIVVASEIGSASHTGNVTAPDPAPVPVADLLDPGVAETWEGVLVSVENIAVVQASPGDDPGTAYYDESAQWTVGAAGSDLWIDGSLWPRPASVAAGACFARISGPLRFVWGRHRISPRSDADVVAGACP